MAVRRLARKVVREAGRLAAAFLVLCAAPAGPARADAPDSLARFVWGAVYTPRLEIVRTSAAFPWNDEETVSHLADRLAVFGEARARAGLAVFLKGAAGRRLEGWSRENRFMLDQGHVSFALPGAPIDGRLFLRERLFRTDHRLMKIVSDDAPFLEGRGEGLALAARIGQSVRIQYLETAERDPAEVERAGGLPLFRGGCDVFRLLRFEAARRGRFRAGALLSQVRSLSAGDAVMVGVDIEARSGEIALIAELYRSQPGGWDDLGGASLFDLDFGRFDLDEPSRVFSENDAFHLEIEGLTLRGGRFGSAGVVPGYRFAGAAFANPQGEIAPGADEAAVLVWWRPPKSDALLSIDAADGSRAGEAYRRLAGEARLRYRGGFEVSSRVIADEGDRPALVVSLASDIGLSRTLLASRIDDFGDRNDLAFFAQSSIRLTGAVTAGGALYLFGSRTSRYSVGFEFRPRGRFLLTVAGGSFTPGFEAAAMRFGEEPVAPPEDRSLVISGRFALGGL